MWVQLYNDFALSQKLLLLNIGSTKSKIKHLECDPDIFWMVGTRIQTARIVTNHTLVVAVCQFVFEFKLSFIFQIHFSQLKLCSIRIFFYLLRILCLSNFHRYTDCPWPNKQCKLLVKWEITQSIHPQKVVMLLLNSFVFPLQHKFLTYNIPYIISVNIFECLGDKTALNPDLPNGNTTIDL